MKRIYHTWNKWECYRAGFYELKPPKGMTAEEARHAYASFLSNLPLFEKFIKRVFKLWPNSCEHYLTNENMNRIAWIGNSAMCLYSGVPRGYRSGFHLLSKRDQVAADNMALKWLNLWLKKHGGPKVNMEQAGVFAKADLY